MQDFLLLLPNLAIFSTLLDQLPHVKLETVLEVQGVQIQSVDLDLAVDVEVLVNEHHKFSVVVIRFCADGVVAAVVKDYFRRQLVHAVANFAVSNVLGDCLNFVDVSPLAVDKAALACDDFLAVLIKDWDSLLDPSYFRLATLEQSRFAVFQNLLGQELFDLHAAWVRLACFTDSEGTHVIELDLLVIQDVA